MHRRLARFPRAPSIRVSIFGHYTLTTVRAGIVLAQPGPDAFGVEPVLAWKDCDGAADLDFVHADAAFCFSVIAEVAFADGFGWESFDGGFGGWAGGVACLVLFHELCDDAVERFLTIDCVACYAAWRTEELEEVGKRGHAVNLAVWSADDKGACEAVWVVERVGRCSTGSAGSHAHPAACWHDADVAEDLGDHLFEVVGLALERLGSIGVAWEEVAAEVGV